MALELGLRRTRLELVAPEVAHRVGVSQAESDSMGGVVAKRILDATAGVVFLLLASPALVVALLAVWAWDQHPPLFTQVRAGMRGRVFQIIKLRTMRVNEVFVQDLGQVNATHPLVTPPGRVLRRLKLDELPQLWNVIRGDMSLVGPRPTVPEQVREYDAFQLRRLSVRPGMTGWAQVHGNTNLPWEDRILLDVWYVDHWSLVLDLKILMRTAAVVLLGERVDTSALEGARSHAHRFARGG